MGFTAKLLKRTKNDLLSRVKSKEEAMTDNTDILYGEGDLVYLKSGFGPLVIGELLPEEDEVNFTEVQVYYANSDGEILTATLPVSVITKKL